MLRTFYTTLFIIMSVAACSSRGDVSKQDSASSADMTQWLIGSWQGQNDTRGSMSFVFNPNHTVAWIFSSPSGLDTMHVTYSVTEHNKHLLIDLSGFDAGPLEGQVMYGLIGFDDQNTLRMDLEPGSPGNDEPRPADLTSPDVLTLVRDESY